MVGSNKKSLSYSSAAHGGWGLVRVGMLVPESYQLFVCPFACGRHGAIGAITHGNKDRLSYLYIDETDIVSGGYETMVVQAVDELLEIIGYHPKVLMIFVSCLDDLLGTDHESFLRPLREKYPHMRFTVGHMNPIRLDGKQPPIVNAHCKMYGLLEKRTQGAKAVNLIGNHVPIPHEGELHRLLTENGYRVRQIGECETFEDFLAMAESHLNIVTRPYALQAAKEMQKTLGIDYLFMPLAHDLNEQDAYYRQLTEKLSLDTPVQFQELKNTISRKAHVALSIVGKQPVSVDFSATLRPFSLAKSLTELGFAVREVVSDECTPLEQASRQWLSENTQVQWINPTHHNAIDRQQNKDFICVGLESAYYNNARHVVGMMDGEGIYGYHGLGDILEKITYASKESTDVEKLIKSYGLVV